MSTFGEHTDVRPRPHRGDDLDSALIVRVAIVFVAGIAAAILVVAFLFRVLEHAHPHRGSEAAPVVTASDLPPLPRLQTDPALDLEQVRAAEDRHLARYAWIDRARGTAQIPIDRAMALWVRNYGGSAATNSAPAVTELQMRQDKAKEAPHAP